MSTQPDDPSGDTGHSDVVPGMPSPPRAPRDVERLGLDRNTEEGAGLDGSRRRRRLMAWTIIFLVFLLPLVLTAIQAVLEH